MATMHTPRGGMRKGALGESVRELQTKLGLLGFDVEPNGVFDEDTEKAVIEIQSLFGHTADGIVGPVTRKLIDAQIGYGWNIRLPNAQELALRTQGKEPGTEGGVAHGRMGGEWSQNVIEVPRAPTLPDARHTAAPDLAGSHVAPGASKPAGAPGSTPSSTLPKTPPQGSPLKR